MKRLPLQPEGCFHPSVHLVAQKRMAHTCHMNPDLVSPSRLQTALYIGVISETLQHPVMGDCLPSPRTHHSHLLAIRGVAADKVCNSIATADAAWHGGSEEFAQTLAACRERYSSGRVAELLDVLEREHAASMERNHGQSQ